MRTRKAWQIWCLLAMLAGGCQKTPGPLTQVQGRVTHRGFALPGGTIVFVPDASRGETGPIAFSKIRNDGSFSLQTGDVQGAPAGWYRITVTSLASSSNPASGTPFNIPQSFISEKYRDPEMSQLACEIQANRANTIDFNLE